MATSTSNLGLIKPAGTDHALVANINTNSETIDAEAGNVRGNFALVQNGDTATQAISKDQLVVWKGVLKKATANIASGATLSNSNLTDDSIATELAALNSNLATQEIQLSLDSSQSGVGNISEIKMYKSGNVVTISGYVSGLSATAGGATILNFPVEYIPKQCKVYGLPVRGFCIINSGYDAIKMGGVVISGDSTTGYLWVYSNEALTSFGINVSWIF